MPITPVEGYTRIGCFHYIYAEAAEKGYSEYLIASSELSAIGGAECDEKVVNLKNSRNIAGLQTILFSAMTFEAAIYDFASVHLGDNYVKSHLDKLDPLSKWLVVLRLVTGLELSKGEAPYAALKSLISARNQLVHSKSEAFDYDRADQQLTKHSEHEINLNAGVHNSFRALVLMSLYWDKKLKEYANPLPSYDKVNAPWRRYYSELKTEIEKCRNIV